MCSSDPKPLGKGREWLRYVPGRTFGRWTLLESADALSTTKKVLCRCKCGTERRVALRSLIDRRSRSCGECGSRGRPDRRHVFDIKPKQVFGYLFVVSVEGKRKEKVKARCCCGSVGEYRSSDVLRGRRVSCGCRKRGYRVGLVGDRYGDLEIIAQVVTETSHRKVRCRCRCGRELEVSLWSLQHGLSNCEYCDFDASCRRDYRVGLPGEVYGNLTIVSEAARVGNQGLRRVWCRCGCGEEVPVLVHRLRSGLVQNCGCGKWPSPVEEVDVGDIYGSRIVVRDEKIVRGMRYVRCRCMKCGTEIVVNAWHILNDTIAKCGCFAVRANQPPSVPYGSDEHPF